MTEVRPILPPPVPALPRDPFIYKFWGTLIWSAVFVAVMLISAFVGLVLAALWYGVDFHAAKKTWEAFFNSGFVVGALPIAAAVPTLLTLALAIRLAGQKFVDYLALRRPSVRHACIGLGATALLMVLFSVASALMGRPATPEVLFDRIRTMREYGALGSYALLAVVVAPILEETFFRGFIYRGFAASRLGTVGAVILSALIFAAAHMQYDLLARAGMMALGLLLGTMRAVSGSTLLTMAMHALNNGVAMLGLWFSD